MSGAVWTGPAAVAAGVLLVAGAAKVVRPDDTARALRIAGLPARPGVVRLGALAEVGIGAAALLGGHAVPRILVALSYVAFTAFLLFAMARHLPLSSCGCFGEPDVPPTTTHVVVDLVAALAVGGAATVGAPGFVEVLGDQPLAGVPFAVLVAVGVAAAVLVLTTLPRLHAARSVGASGSGGGSQ